MCSNIAKGITEGDSLIPLHELLTRTRLSVNEAKVAAKGVIFHMDNFSKFANFMDKVANILKELSSSELDESFKSLCIALGIVNGEATLAKQVAVQCRTRSKIYLLVNSRKILEGLGCFAKEIFQALSLISSSSLDVPLSVNNKIGKLGKGIKNYEFVVAEKDDEVLRKMERGIQERNGNTRFAGDLLASIAEAIGMSSKRSPMRREIEQLKKDIEDVKQEIGIDEVAQLNWLVAQLEKTDVRASNEETKRRYLDKRHSLGMQPLKPLESFICPITLDVMADPVEISSGRTVERSAIEKWFADGHKLCPLTSSPLDTSVLRPNRNLQKSINEWNENNSMIKIISSREKLKSLEEQEVLQALATMQELCSEQKVHREWVALEGCIPDLASLLRGKNRQVRTHSIAILCLLARDSTENREEIAKTNNALESIVKSLSRQIGESKLALQLLLQLTRVSTVRHTIGTIKGCIFLLTTMLNSDDAQVSRDATELLDDLCFLDQNVIDMAKQNFFEPLLQRLASGPDGVRLIMAKALCEIELTDHSKLSLFKHGALGSLLELLSHDEIGMRTVAVKVLQNLSSLPQNGLQMIREGAVGPLFEILYRHGLSSPSLREQVATIITNLAISTNSQEAGQEQVSLLESDEEIFKFFSLVPLTGPDIQNCILQAFNAMCQSPSGPNLRGKLRQLSIVQVLVQMCELTNYTIRSSALKLFYCLTEDGDVTTLLEHVDRRCIETLLRIIKTSDDLEEIGAATGIISNLQMGTEMTQWLIDAGAIDIIFDLVTDKNRNTSSKEKVTGNALKALCRFTVSTHEQWQKQVAETGIISVLVQLLVSGTSLMKKNSAISLKQFSESSAFLSKPVKRHPILKCCFATPEKVCPVHLGVCTVESSFCIIEAGAVQPLVTVMMEKELEASEASLDALLTLIDGEMLQSGSKMLDKANAIPLIIKLLSLDSTNLQKKALEALGRIFQLSEYKQMYATRAQMPLVEITQRGSSSMKSLAARVLTQLGVLDQVSSLF